jgi:hypothetical protein
LNRLLQVKRVQNLLLLFVTVSVFLLCLETALGILKVKFWVPPLGNEQFNGYRIKHRPNQGGYYDFIDELPAEVRYYKLNSFGDRTVEKCFDNYSLKVFMLGDSFTWGLGVAQNKDFPSVLQRKLLDDGSDVCILNLAYAGAGTTSIFRKLRDNDVKNYGKPDVVIYNFFPNDFSDNYEDFRFHNALTQNSFAYHRVYKLLLYPIFVQDSLKFDFMPYAVEQPHDDYFHFTKTQIKLMNEFLKERDIEFIVSYVPSKAEVEGEWGEHRMKSYFGDKPYDLGQPHREFLKITGDLNITTVDFYERLRDRSRQERVYYLNDFHLNEAAHAYLAELFFRELGFLRAGEIDLLSFKTDRGVYHSREDMEIMVSVASKRHLQDVLLRLKGIYVGGRYNRYYLDKAFRVNLSEGINDFPVRYKMPPCTACSGIRPGVYGISVELSSGDKVLANSSFDVEIKQ